MKKIKDAYLKIYSLLAFGLAVIGILLLLYENNIFSTNSIGFSIQICMIILMIWARITFGIRSFHASANTTKGIAATVVPASKAIEVKL